MSFSFAFACLLALVIPLASHQHALTAAESLSVKIDNPIIPGYTFEGQLIYRGRARPAQWEFTGPIPDGLEADIYTNRVQQSIINNDVSLSVGIAIRAERPGSYVLPAARVRMRNGSEILSEPLTIVATAPDPDLQGSYIARISVEPAFVVPGQDCVITWECALPHSQRRLETAAVGERLVLDGPDHQHLLVLGVTDLG